MHLNRGALMDALGTGEAGAARASAALVHMPVLDGLRGVAILLVLVHHLHPLSQQNPLRHVVQDPAWTGVDLFFVLSGFLITRILLAERTGASYFERFYVRRALRIFPLYYASTLLIALVLPRLGLLGEQVAPGYLWAVLLYLQNCLPESVVNPPTGNLLAVTWSLCIEEQFYLVWPAVVRFVRPERLVLCCIGGVLLALATRVLAGGLAPDPSQMFRWAPARLDSLLLGAGVALAHRRDPSLRALLRWAPWCALLSVLGLVTIGVLEPLHFREPLTRTFGLSLVALLCACGLVWTLTRSHARVLSSSVLGFFGKYSYGLYLLHGLAGGFTNRVWRRLDAGSHTDSALMSLVYFACAMGVSVLLALISWRVLEQPFLRMKARWSIGVSQR